MIFWEVIFEYVMIFISFYQLNRLRKKKSIVQPKIVEETKLKLKPIHYRKMDLEEVLNAIEGDYESSDALKMG